MPTYTLTAEFHIEGDFDEFLSYEENYENMLRRLDALSNPAFGIHLIKVTEIEED
jgi:hypothetical protein